MSLLAAPLRKLRTSLAVRLAPPGDESQRRELLRAAYLILLGREPDPAGLSVHLARLEGKTSWESVLASLVASDEFKARDRRTLAREEHEAMVRGAYRVLLRREPDPETLQRQTTGLQQGRPISALLGELLAEPELFEVQTAIDERMHPGAERREDLALRRRLVAIEESIGRLAAERR